MSRGSSSLASFGIVSMGRSFTGWLVLAAFVLDDVGLSFRHDVLRNSRKRTVPEAGSAGNGAYRAASLTTLSRQFTAASERRSRETASRDQPCRGSNLPSGSGGGQCNQLHSNSGLIGTSAHNVGNAREADIGETCLDSRRSPPREARWRGVPRAPTLRPEQNGEPLRHVAACYDASHGDTRRPARSIHSLRTRRSHEVDF
jgi:hypothetical protein